MVSSWYPYLCAFGLTISIFLCVTFNNLALMNMQILGWNAKCAVIGLMYRKVSTLLVTKCCLSFGIAFDNNNKQ